MGKGFVVIDKDVYQQAALSRYDPLCLWLQKGVDRKYKYDTETVKIAMSHRDFTGDKWEDEYKLVVREDDKQGVKIEVEKV